MGAHWVLRTGLLMLASVALFVGNAGAQADLNCDNFATQPEAQASLNSTFPEDPDRLDADSDWIACEDFFGLTEEEAAGVVPANLVSNSSQPVPEPAPTPAPVDSVPASVPTSTVTSSRIDPPADLMAQVASCEVVAVSSRSIAAAGCPGVGTIVLRPSAGTPRMRSQVIIRPGAAFGVANNRVETAAQTAHPDRASETRDRRQRERPRKKHQRSEMTSSREK